MKQIERIKLMEQHLDRAASAVKRLSTALDEYETAQDAIKALSDYYGSKEWKQDFADDESRQRNDGKGSRWPEDLKRGVLSEDAIWNLLEDCKALREQCAAIAAAKLP